MSDTNSYFWCSLSIVMMPFIHPHNLVQLNLLNVAICCILWVDVPSHNEPPTSLTWELFSGQSYIPGASPVAIIKLFDLPGSLGLQNARKVVTCHDFSFNIFGWCPTWSCTRDLLMCYWSKKNRKDPVGIGLLEGIRNMVLKPLTQIL